MGDDRLTVSNLAVAVARKIGGRTRSYDWLVRAQCSNNGWLEYWSNLEDVRERWRLVHRDFPDRWRDFLRESIQPPPGVSPHFGMTVARLVEYLFYFERCEDAYATVYQLVDTISDLFSGQRLLIPSWIGPTSGGP